MAKPQLSVYLQKRDFSQTPEPRGDDRVPASDRLRFVVQKHAAGRLHFDLRLEFDGVFKSWAITRGPSLNPADKRLAVETEDHPLAYGDFEGNIPKGQYGGGTMQIWDRGYWSPEGGKTPEQAFAGGDLKFNLDGARLRGSWVLVRMRKDRDGGKRINWLLIKHKDQSAQPGGTDALLAEDRSVASRRTMKQIAEGRGQPPKPFVCGTGGTRSANATRASRITESAAKLREASTARSSIAKKVPQFIEPQLCKLVYRPPTQAGWGHEVKFDGYRAQLRVHRGIVVIRTRRGLDWTNKFGAIAEAAEAFPDVIIDGEIVALDQRGMPSFTALQAALSEKDSSRLVFFAFDMLFNGFADLRTEPLIDRKRRLEAVLDAHPLGKRLRYVQHFESTSDTVLLSACKMELEGIISKKLNAPYLSGRSGSWTKAKCRAGHEVVLGGWTSEGGTVRSLLAGVNRHDHLVYVGRVGSGYNADVAKKLLPKLKALSRNKSPFGGDNAPAQDSKIRWLKPTLVAEIDFGGWTAAGMIRQASFKGLRSDKRASDVVAEIPTLIGDDEATPTQKLASRVGHETGASRPKGGATPIATSRALSLQRPAAKAGTSTIMGVVISKPDKPLWPDAGDKVPVTKLDLAQYYERVGHWLLPHLKGRPCSLVRAPDGVAGEQFFQRHAMAGISNLVSLVKVKGDKAPYVQIDRVEAMVAVAQIGALEIHPWNCAPNDPEVAGRLVFDLDPAPDVKFAAVIKAALEIRDRLKEFGLESFCKTTGGKGLHVVTALLPGKESVAWPAAKTFAHMVCAQMAHDAPETYLDTMSKSQRVGRIFLDYLRNDRTATAVAVLSSRARAGAPVSMPIHWNEVKTGFDPTVFTVRTAPEILGQKEPWKGYEDSARSLAAAIRKMTA